MKTQEEIKGILDRKIRLYARTGNDKFLIELSLLQDILSISDKEIEKLLNEAINKKSDKL